MKELLGIFMVCGLVLVLSEVAYCGYPGDFDDDGDVDCLDLAIQAGGDTDVSLEDFVPNFGKIDIENLCVDIDCGGHGTCVDGTCECTDGYTGNLCDNPPQKIVFVTESLHTGNLGGIAGADAICQTEAIGAGLTGSYKAWLSGTDGSQPAMSFTQSIGPYVLPDGTLVAFDWSSLTSGSLISPINKTASGCGTECVVSPAKAWTNTITSGWSWATWPGDNCMEWTVDDSGFGSATYGDIDARGPEWTEGANGFQLCDRPLHLYCFQQ